MLYRTHRIFLDFFHHPVFQKTRRFGNWICFRPQVNVGKNTPTQSWLSFSPMDNAYYISIRRIVITWHLCHKYSFWGVTLCSPAEFHRRFGETTKAGFICRLLLVGCSLGSLFFDPESGIIMFLRNCSQILPGYIALHPRIQTVPGEKVNILGGHSIGHSKQNSICTCVLFRTISLIELILCTVHCTQYRRATRQCPHTSCKVHWSWRWNSRKCIILGKLYQVCPLNNEYRY
jgi:hypothetical protein